MMAVFASHGNDVWNRHHCSRAAAGGCDGSVFSVSSGGGGLLGGEVASWCSGGGCGAGRVDGDDQGDVYVKHA